MPFTPLHLELNRSEMKTLLQCLQDSGQMHGMLLLNKIQHKRENIEIEKYLKSGCMSDVWKIELMMEL